MRKIGVNDVRIYERRKKGLVQIREIFLEEDRARMKMRLNAYRTHCLNNQNTRGLKRADLLRELMDTL